MCGCIGALLALTAAPVVTAPPSTGETSTWVAMHAVSSGDGEIVPGSAEARALDHLSAGARVFAFGEPTHSAHEPLAARNRLIRYFVAHQGVTTVTFESGFAQGLRIDAYIAGGPGDAVAVSRDYLSWTFGDYRANVEIIKWLRGWNADRRHARVHFVGADASGGAGESGMSAAPLVIKDLTAYLGRALPTRSSDVRRALAVRAESFTDTGYAALSAAERKELDDALSETGRLLKTHRTAAIAKTSRAEYDDAVHETLDAGRVRTMLALWPQGPAAAQIEGWLRVSDVRDRTMADHVLWALERDGPKGRVFSFAHDGHVAAADMQQGEVANGDSKSMGQNLRAALGLAYRVVFSLSATSPVPAPEVPVVAGSLDEMLRSAGKSSVLIDIREAPGNWWDQRQSAWFSYRGRRNFVPRAAADGFLQLDRLTCEPTTRPSKNECVK